MGGIHHTTELLGCDPQVARALLDYGLPFEAGGPEGMVCDGLREGRWKVDQERKHVLKHLGKETF